MSILFNAEADQAYLAGLNTKALTVCGWIYVTGSSGGNWQDGVIEWAEADTWGAAVEIVLDSPNYWALVKGTSFDTSDTTVVEDAWHFIALVLDDEDARFYLNGALDCEITGESDNDTATHIRFSQWTNDIGNEGFVGRFYGAKAWAAVLTLPEILNERSLIRVTRTADLLGMWPMLPGATERLMDYSGLGNDLTEGGTLSDAAPAPVSWGSASLLQMPPVAATGRAGPLIGGKLIDCGLFRGLIQ